jgi:vitamin B12 transporter
MKKIILISLLSGLISSQSLASDIDINPIVVSGNLREQKLSDVMTSVSVITRKDIDRLNPQDIGSLLQGQAGVEIVSTGGLGMQTSIFIRGSNSSQALVLVDGLKVMDEFSNATPLQNIPVSQVDHIEILRGNASALYGPRAVGGVIQIFTKSNLNKQSGVGGSVSSGSRNTQNYNASYRNSFNDTTFNVSVNHQETNGFPTLNPKQNDSNSIANSTKSSYDSNSISAQLSTIISPGHEIGYKILANEFNVLSDTGNKSEFINFTSANSNYMSSLNSKNIFNQIYTKNEITSFWNSKISFGTSNITNRVNYNFEQSGIPIANYTTQQKDFSWTNDFFISKNQTIILGLQSNQISTKNNDPYYSLNLCCGFQPDFSASRVINSVFMGHTAKYDRIGTQINIRHDNINTGESATTGLFGLSYDLTNHIKWAGNISNAFNPPSTAQLSSINAGGNAALKSEEDKSIETSIQYLDQDTLARIVLFKKETTNLIQATGDLNAVGFRTLLNTAQASNTGIEITAQTKMNNLILKGSATLQDPINKLDSSQLARRAKEFGSLEVSYPYEKYNVGAQLLFSSSTRDLLVADGCPPGNTFCTKNSGYSITNLFASYRYDKDWSLSLKVENLFDRNYQKVYGYNTPGFGAFLTIQYSPENK